MDTQTLLILSTVSMSAKTNVIMGHYSRFLEKNYPNEAADFEKHFDKALEAEKLRLLENFREVDVDLYEKLLPLIKK